MQAITGLICAFSPGGDILAIATDDGRVRTFDTASGRLRATLGQGSSDNAGVSNGFLTEKHTCLSWVVFGGRKEKQKKKHGDVQQGLITMLVVGTAAGDVKAYDTQLGELKWRSKNAVEGGVAALAANSEAIIYATGASKQIVSLNATSGEVTATFEASKHEMSCLSIAPDNASAFGGGSGLSLWDLVSHERKAKFTGHPSPAGIASYAPDGRHAISAAQGERHIAVWTTQLPLNGKRIKKSQPAVASLALEDPAVLLDTCRQHEQQLLGSFNVAAVSEVGEAYVWSCQDQGDDGSLQTRLLARIRVGGVATKGAAAGAEECIMAVRLQPGSNGPSLLIARGSSAKPVFEKIHVPSQSTTDGMAPIISLQPTSGGVLLNGPSSSAKVDKTKSSHTREDITVLGPENLGQPVVVRVGKGKRSEPEADTLLGSDHNEEEIPDLPQDEVPLGERVASMVERAQSGYGAEAIVDEEAGPSGQQQLPQGSSKADSLAVLLTQALRSNDRALLEKCLATTGTKGSRERIIANTVRRLIPMDAAAFLRAAVDRIMSKPVRAVQLAPWIKAVMHHHTGYLMTAPAVQGSLAALYQAIDNRVGLYQQLLKLYGRLSLITAHSTQSSQEKSGEDPDDGLPGPEIVFQDVSDDEPEAEDPFAPEGTEDEDDEDDEEDEDENEDEDMSDDEEDEEEDNDLDLDGDEDD